MVRTTLGPRGLDKMLVSSGGKVVVTNDGASILDRIDVDHPAAKLAVEVAQQQDSRAGDGTTSAFLLTGELLKQARDLMDRGVHQHKIIQGYQLAADSVHGKLTDLSVQVDRSDDELLRDVARTVVTGKWNEDETEFLVEKAVAVIREIERDGRVRFDRITRKTLPGGSLYDSMLIHGLVIDLDESSTDLITAGGQTFSEDKSSRIALIDEELSIDKADGVGAVTVQTYDEHRQLQAYEQDVYSEHVSSIVNSGADIVFCQQSIDTPVQRELADNGILAVERTRRDELQKLARATGAQPVLAEDLTPAVVGQAAEINHRQLGSTPLLMVSGYDELDHISLVLRGGTAHVAEETRRKIEDCLYVLRLAIEDQLLVPGGGATEMALAKECRRMGNTYAGREQLAVEAFADALETLPATLVQSAGMDPIDTLAHLRNVHAEGSEMVGVNVESSRTENMVDSGIVEPLHIKNQMIMAAVDAASLILRIDDQIATDNPNLGQNEHDHEHDHESESGGMVHSTDGYPWAVGHSMGHDH